MTTPVLSEEDRAELRREALHEHHEEDMSWLTEDLEDDDES